MNQFPRCRAVLAAAFLGGALGVAAAADDAPPPNDTARTSYAIGLDVARNFRKNGIAFDPAWVTRGLTDGLGDGRPLLKEKELRKLLNDFQNAVRQRMSVNQRLLASDNRKKAAAFLDAHRAEPGVQVLPGGIQYKVLREGAGLRATDVDTVQVNYRGTLLDGSEFDGTEPGRPGTLALPNAFTGLREAIKQMPAGSRWQVWIPPQLGYGERGVGNDVGPNELLTYDLEVVRVVPAAGR